MFLCKLKLLTRRHKFILEVKRCLTNNNFESIHHILTEDFGLRHHKATQYINEERLSTIEPNLLIKSASYCKNLGYDNESILNHPILLRTNPITLDQYYTAMQEGGFVNINAATLAKCRSLCRRKISLLKEARLIDKETDVASAFIKHLNPCPEDFEVQTDGDFDSWTAVHFKVLFAYLKWRLQVSEEDLNKMLNTHIVICRKSFKYLCENIAFVEELGFTPEKMLKYGYILHSYPKHYKEILEKYPELAGASMKRAMRMYPKLLNVSPASIEKIYATLKQHNISDEAIQKRMNVFHLSPDTVKYRLDELKTVSDFKVLRHNPNILKLVVHHNRAKSRLSFLKETQLKCAGVSVLGNDDIKFNIHIKEGRDTNSFMDIYSFLKGIFNKDVKYFENKLKKHPFFLHVPLISMEDTYTFLKNEKFTDASIFDVIYILLYPRDKIKAAFKKVNLFEIQRSRVLNQSERLTLVVYFIEKDHHFTGDGVWKKFEDTEESSL